MKTFRADLHVHTVLSPCAGVEMIPPLIVRTALERGISLIAISDHNATANIASVQKAALGTGLTVLPAMELQTREEIHCLCLFDELDQALVFQKVVDSALPPIDNDPEYFGEQFVVDETGDFLSRETRMLLASTSISLKSAWEQVTRIGGLLVPAHIDRQAFGLLPTLGFVPADIPLRILEISRFITFSRAFEKFPQLRNFALIQNGDVHYLDDFLGAMFFDLESATINELQMAIFKQEGRQLKFHSELQ